MKFTLPTIALLALVVCASATLAASNTTSSLEEEAIQVIHSGGDPLGDDDYTELADPVRRNKKHTAKKNSHKHTHKHSKKSANNYVSTEPDSGAKVSSTVVSSPSLKPFVSNLYSVLAAHEWKDTNHLVC